MASHTLFIFVISGLLIQCHGYSQYRFAIPNGENVKHPCKPNLSWDGVGHEYSGGGGTRNRFGQDFSRYKMWSNELCQMDSDGDGLSNGEELGDPQCVWQQGKTPNRTVNITHPGICNEMNSEHCKSINSFIDCDAGDFKCDGINEVGTTSKDIRFPQTLVPNKTTSYHCMYFNFPQDADYHLIATQPHIDNNFVTHHILIFGCEDTVLNNSQIKMEEPQSCGMYKSSCEDIIALWTVGHAGSCYHKDTGFRIGTKGYKVGLMQIHWNNPENRNDYTDSSGLKLYYQPKRRPFDSGVLIVGQTFIEIPPNQDKVVVNGVCSKSCTSKIFLKPFNVTSGVNHMHYKGRQEKITLYRNNVAIKDVAYDEVFEYDSPVVHSFDQPVVVYPNDEFRITCIYDSVNAATTTTFGDATADEMCFGFITYYPRESISNNICTSWKSLPSCDFLSGTVDGCNMKEMFDRNNPKTMAIGMNIMQNCQPFVNCTSKCLEAYRPYKDEPCLVGDVGYLVRRRSSRLKFQASLFLAIDSCAIEMYKEKHPCDMAPNDHPHDMMNTEKACDLEEILNPDNTKAQSLRTDVKSKCKQLASCRHECLALLHEIYRGYPCLHSSKGDPYKIKAKSDEFLYDIFSGLDSCKVDYYKSQSPCKVSTTAMTTGTTKNTLSAFLFSVVLIFVWL